MTTKYLQSPKLLKGALVELSQRFVGSVPNVIIFQYNPVEMTRELTPWQPPRPEAEPAEGEVETTG